MTHPAKGVTAAKGHPARYRRPPEALRHHQQRCTANTLPGTAAPTLSGTIAHRGGNGYSIANRSTGLVLDGDGNVASGSVTKQ